MENEVGLKSGKQDTDGPLYPGVKSIQYHPTDSFLESEVETLILNEEKTDLNVIVGLCLGHDISFTRVSKAPVTTLIVKDRRLGHNPAAALYQGYPPCNFYYGRLGKATSETGGR